MQQLKPPGSAAPSCRRPWVSGGVSVLAEVSRIRRRASHVSVGTLCGGIAGTESVKIIKMKCVLKRQKK